MDVGLYQKKAVVMAASSGLGFACARSLAEEGADLLICGRDSARLEHAVAQIRDTGAGSVWGVVADVGQEEDLARLFEEAERSLGGLDILVCNAGGPPSGTFQNLTAGQWDAAYITGITLLVDGGMVNCLP